MPLDPLSALSLAACVIQFVDFSSKIVSKGVEIYNTHDGAILHNAEIEQAADRLNQLSETLTLSNQQDPALQIICQNCRDISRELVAHLENLKVVPGSKYRRWRSARKAVKSVWSADDQERIVSRLNAARNELETHVMADLRQQIITLSQANEGYFDALDQGMRTTVNSLLEQRIAVDQIMLQLGQLNVNLSFVTEEQARDRNRRIELRILESLKFDAMDDRAAAIAEAHSRTFEWIFHTPSRTQLSWSDFSSWLKHGTDAYWIQGKAGSGKSTLMRFIIAHPQTTQELRLWVRGNGTTQMASAFFWKGGVQDQRSLTGLLRTLLWETLDRRRDLIRYTFPAEWARLSELAELSLPMTMSAWTFSHLHAAFKNLTAQATESLKFCFFIDGLDELEGDQSDHSSVISFVHEFGKSEFVKFCVSSRPWPIFQRGFAKFPGLKLQDLTRNDIWTYTQEKLLKAENMLEIAPDMEDLASSLIQDIVDNAAGVFLWVQLVVKSLLGGLENGDSIEDLRKRLELIPTDLESLYGQMLQNIDKLYTEAASKVFQLLRESVKRSFSLSVQRLDMTLQWDGPKTAEIVFNRIKAADNMSEAYHKLQEKKLHARCGGLLEVQYHGEPGVADARPGDDPVVQYLHRSVADYLAKPEVWEELISHTSHKSFEPQECLLSCLILEFRKQRLYRAPNLIEVEWTLWSDIKSFLSKDSAIDGEKQVALLDMFDRALSDPVGGSGLAERPKDSNPYKWVQHYYQSGWRFDMLSLAVYEGLHAYVKTKISSNREVVQQRRSPPLLAFALKWINMREPDDSSATVKLLLEAGASPNEYFGKYTLWEYTIHYAHTRGDGFTATPWLDTRHKWQEIFKLMLNHGADPIVSCFGDGAAWNWLLENEEERVEADVTIKFRVRAESHYAITGQGFELVPMPSTQQSLRHSLPIIVEEMFGGGSDQEQNWVAELQQLIKEKCADRRGGTSGHD